MAPLKETRVLEAVCEVRTSPNGHAVIEGYAARFNRYSENLGGFVESIRPGAFKRAIEDPNIHGKYEHELVLGRTGAGTLRISEDAEGLPYEIDINPKDPQAMSVLAKVERGDVNKSSFAFTVTRDGDEWDETEEGFPLREITSIARLFDVSIVSTPAYPDTDSKVRALRGLASSIAVPSEVVIAAADSGELIDLIRTARSLSTNGAQPPPEPTPEPPAAVAPVVAVRLERERLASRRRALSRSR